MIRETFIYAYKALYRLLGSKKVFPYSLPSVGPGGDPGVLAVSPQVTLSHLPGGRLPLLSVKPAVTSAAFTKWRHMIAYVRFQLTTLLSALKG